MNIFLTGATGYIGAMVAQKLKDKGHQITSLVRTPENAARLRALGHETVIGDMFQPERWKNEAVGADGIIHCAQIPFGRRVGMSWVRCALEADQTAFGGLIEAAKNSEKCKILIYTSGVSVVGDYGDQWTDESTVPKPSHTVGSYHLSGEQLAQRAYKEGLPIVILRPSLPVSSGGTFSSFFLAQARNGKLRHIGNGKNFFPTVHGDDLANAYSLAVERPPVGETIIISDDEPVRMIDFCNILLKEFGDKKAKNAAKWLVALFAGKPLANLLTSSYRVRNDKAKKLLGWKPQYPTFRDSLKQVLSSATSRFTT